MARRILIAGNWKMNRTGEEAIPLINGLKEQATVMLNVDVAVCPPFTSLGAVVEATRGTPIKVGAQNVHWEASGAFTGEISASMLKSIPVSYVIIGHSERRQYFGETDATVNKRLLAALKADLIPIVCVGETLEQRDADQTRAVVTEQIEKGLASVTAAQAARIVIAYEPVWAIGTGRTATPEQAQGIHALIRGLLGNAFGEVAGDMRILYGGSMKPATAAELLAQPDIDGGLIGGASLKADEFLAIIASA